jgi:hypothetical protein
MFNLIPDWLTEQERKKNPSIFLLEWLSAFAVTFPFWTFLFFKLENSFRLIPAAAAISALYACGFVYLRIYPVTHCKKCTSLLPLVKVEIGRRHIHDEEKCKEIERGGEDYWQHFIDLYNRIYRVDIVKFRCLRCKAVWEEVEQNPVSKYRFIRTITVKD